MAVSKVKHLEAAQKFLSQGKISQAISEYEQILRQEPRDQVTLMTVGDLYVRAGDTSKALEYFTTLAQVFLADGFNSKAIAIYKKIAKLAPDSTAALEKLAELYVQQGVMSEARPLYLQLAESHLRAGRNDRAVEVLRQLIDLEPDNLRVQLRLAELYQSIGQQQEAAHAFLNCAHRMFDHGHFAEAQKFADQALKADPGNARAITVKARASAALGRTEEAIAALEALPDAARGTDITQLLLGFYLQTQHTEKSVALARRVLAEAPERYNMVYELSLSLLDGGEAERALELLGEIRPAMLQASDFDRLAQALANVAERLPGRLDALDWLVDTYRQASDSFRLPQALDQLAEAAASAGKLDRAREVFEELCEREPENEDYRRRLNQVRARLGLEPVEAAAVAPRPGTAAPAAPPPAAVEDEGLDEESRRFVTQALTDVDLFSSYGLTQKAIDLLESALKRAPRHTVVLEKLLDLQLGAGNDRRTSELASQLESIYRERGDAARADRFAELQRRFQRAARLTGEPAPAPPPPLAEFAVTPEVSEPPPAPSEEVAEVASEEVDLSSEWASLSAATSEAPAEVAAEAAAPEGELELSLDEPAAADVIREAEAAVPVEPAAQTPEIEIPLEAAPEPAAPPEPAEIAEPALEAAPSAVEAPPPSVEIEYTLEELPAPAAAAAGPEAGEQESFMSELAAEVDALEFGAPAAAAPPAQAAAPPAPQGSVAQLKEVFDEFRSELGQMGEEEGEDLETHYNLGIAYREMGLLEESIGEFQKVAKAVEGGQAFRYAMQCFTLLGLCFMDKGQPNIAAMWYERALGTPGLDQESVLALRYDLGVAQELAGEPKKALQSFTQVYAMNIDYRDVADRIATLQKNR
jgi:tetratricopeptide (TPR) repeat protein